MQDIIEEEVTPPEEAVSSDPFETNLIELRDTEDNIDDPLIDEPVTGAGNDDLWAVDQICENPSDDDCRIDDPADNAELEPAE